MSPDSLKKKKQRSTKFPAVVESIQHIDVSRSIANIVIVHLKKKKLYI